MPKFFFSDPRKALLCIPFGYAFATRYHWPRNFLVNAVTAWGPGVILIASLCGVTLAQASLLYAVGYVMFISIYEIGYLANDSIGLRYDPVPRERIVLTITPGFLGAFILLRLGVLGLCAQLLGVGAEPGFLAAMATLAVVIALHNVLKRPELKFYSFLQLSLMRFAVPVLPALLLHSGTAQSILLVMATGLLLFTLPRLLTYQDAKGRLHLPERKRADYHLMAHLSVAPMIALLWAVTEEPAPLLCLFWAVSVQLIFLMVGQRFRWTAGRV